MSLKINHNVAAMNSWRNLQKTDAEMNKTLERLSSGSKLNRAADGPANLVIAEQMKAQVKSMEQASENSELAISMVQTAEASLNEVNNILVSLRQLALHAANEGGNDDKMLAADQSEIDNALATIDGISKQAQFGSRMLLDGSNGIGGVATGDGLRYIKAEVDTKSSPADGYEVDIEQVATKARLEGERPLSEEEINAGGIQIALTEGGRSLSYFSKVGETMDTMLRNLQLLADQNDLKVNVGLTEDKRMFVEHQEYGSEPSFSAMVSVGGLLTSEANQMEESIQGNDVQGTIGGEMAYGEGQFLTAAKNSKADGLTVEYTGGVKSTPKVDAQGNPAVDAEGKPLPPEGTIEGTVIVTNNSLHFQVGPGQGMGSRIDLPNMNTHTLSRGIENDSGFESLGELDVTTLQGAQDSLDLIDQAIYQVTSQRGKLGAFQKNTLESNLNNLRYSTENLVSAESVLRDVDMAKEMSEFTKQQILLSSGMAMLGQANQTPKSVLSLINGQ